MPNEEQRLKQPRQNNSNNDLLTVSSDQLDPDEFTAPVSTPDFWGVHAERFRKGLTKQPIVIEHPKQTYILNKGAHYFVIEDLKKRSVVCITCPIRHGGILEAHLLTQYRIEDGVLYFKGKAINTIPEKSVVDNVLKKS